MATEPISYYMSRYSGEQIDQLLTNISCRNNQDLLDNGYWANKNAIINQRGKTEYVGAGITIDRWKIENGLKITVLEKGIKIESVTGSSTLKDFYQITENTYLGETLTLSILTSEGELIQATGTVPTSGSSYVVVADAITAFGTITLYADMSGIVTGSIGRLQASIRLNMVNSVAVLAAKLDFGPNQTLAHQNEDGNWVLNDPPPDYATELQKCQRYYLPSDLFAYLIWKYSNESGGYFIPTPVTMRATPTIIGTVRAQRENVKHVGNFPIIPINKIDVYITATGVYLFVWNEAGLNTGTDSSLRISDGGLSCDL